MGEGFRIGEEIQAAEQFDQIPTRVICCDGGGRSQQSRGFSQRGPAVGCGRSVGKAEAEDM